MSKRPLTQKEVKAMINQLNKHEVRFNPVQRPLVVLLLLPKFLYLNNSEEGAVVVKEKDMLHECVIE